MKKCLILLLVVSLVLATTLTGCASTQKKPHEDQYLIDQGYKWEINAGEEKLTLEDWYYLNWDWHYISEDDQETIQEVIHILESITWLQRKRNVAMPGDWIKFWIQFPNGREFTGGAYQSKKGDIIQLSDNTTYETDGGIYLKLYENKQNLNVPKYDII